MADFDVIHGKQLDACSGRLRIGEIWNVLLCEPLYVVTKGPPQNDPSHNKPVTVVRFVMCRDGRLKPATEVDLYEVMDWKRRHRKTPIEAFAEYEQWKQRMRNRPQPDSF